MVIDTSAIISVLHVEPHYRRILDALEKSAQRHMSAVSVYETRIVLLHRSQPILRQEFEWLLRRLEITIAEFDGDQAFLAARAYDRYGKGMGHPAQLNMGDCAAYALAKSLDLPLLYIGNDFSNTDVKSAL